MFEAITKIFRSHGVSLPPFTPDFNDLMDAPGWPMFEYGSLKAELPNHDVKRLGQFMGHAYTVEKMSLWSRNAGENSDAVAAKFQTTNQPAIKRARVAGELYLTPTHLIPFLDNFRQNGVNFNRKNVKLILPRLDEDNRPVEVRAFMYVGNKDVLSPWMQWDMDFYKGRPGSAFSVVAPQQDGKSWLNWYSNFTKDDFREGTRKCFLGIRDGSIKLEDRGAAPTVSTV